MFGQSSQPSTAFGGGFGSSSSSSSNTGSGHQRTNTSLFAPAASGPTPSQSTTTAGTGLFGSTSNTSAGPGTTTSTTSSFGGFGGFSGGTNATTNTMGFGSNMGNTATSAPGGTTSLFGNTGTSTAGGLAGSTTTPGLGFGSSNPSTSGFKLGSSTSTAQPTTGLFGSSNSMTAGFGGGGNAPTSLFGGGNKSLFTNNTQQAQQQQQQQSNSLLSLRTAFPDTNVPHFIVKPDKVTRTSIPPSLFNKDDQTTKSAVQQGITSTSSKGFGTQQTTLPGFLTSAAVPQSSKSGQKRAFDGQGESERRTLYKQSSNHSGVFGMAGDESFGDSNSRSTKELEDPPVVSLWDIGVNPRKHSSSPDTVKTSNKPDLWTLAVMHSRNAPGKSSLMTQDASSNNNNFLKDSGAAGASIFTPTAPDSQSRKKGGPTIVKVFGYPSGMKVAVIEHFSQCGKVEERYQSGSNWMTFRYESSDAAKEALASHGSIIAKDCMIGVVEAKSMTG